MNGAPEMEDVPPMNAIDEAAAEWVQRRRFWNWSDADQQELDRWLDESMAHRVAYWRLNAAYTRTERLTALRAPVSDARARFRFSPLITGIAASLVLALGAGIFAAQSYFGPQERVFETPIGGHQVISFADGTRIELNTATRIRARMTTKERMVWLDKGEAFFQVHHDAAQPFVVMIGDRRVTDLGTRFVIRRGASETEVAVVQGSVRFDAPGVQSAAHAATLHPGDVAMATSEAMSIAKRSALDLQRELGWRRGVVVFDRTTLADAASEFNRYNERKIVIADPAAASFAIDGTFATSDEEAFIDAARSIFGLHVDGSGKDIVISR